MKERRAEEPLLLSQAMARRQTTFALQPRPFELGATKDIEIFEASEVSSSVITSEGANMETTQRSSNKRQLKSNLNAT